MALTSPFIANPVRAIDMQDKVSKIQVFTARVGAQALDNCSETEHCAVDLRREPGRSPTALTGHRTRRLRIESHTEHDRTTAPSGISPCPAEAVKNALVRGYGPARLSAEGLRGAPGPWCRVPTLDGFGIDETDEHRVLSPGTGST